MCTKNGKRFTIARHSNVRPTLPSHSYHALVAEKAHQKATNTAGHKLAEKEQETSHWNAVAFFRGGLLGVSVFVNIALAGIIIAYAVGSIGSTPGVLDPTVPAVRCAPASRGAV